MRRQPTLRITPRCFAVAAAALVSSYVFVLAAPPAMARDGAGPDYGSSMLGSYLAGRYARSRRDMQAAAAYFQHALRRDPGNVLLLEPAFMMETGEGNWSEALSLASQLVRHKKKHRVANLLLGLAAFKKRRFATAEGHFKAADDSPIGKLTGTLARSWVMLARGRAKQGIKQLSKLNKARSGKFHVNYHSALIADVAGRTKMARASFRRVFKIEKRSLRVALAFARHAAHAGNFKLSEKVLKSQIASSGGEGHALARDLLEQVNAKKKTALLVPTSTHGLAEVFYWLGEALVGVGAVTDGAVYLQLSLYMQPKSPFALEALANIYEATKKFDRALSTYERIPNNKILRSSIEIRKAMTLNRLDQVAQAKEILEALALRAPRDIRPLAALGNIMRTRKRYEEAVGHYDRAIALISKASKKHWAYFYWRGTCFERIKRWSEAEADLQKALELNPNQPQVLNYLGYSWVDQHRNLKKGMALIEQAVRLKPDDGYIVDSLGWAHYRLKNFAKAVKHLERAVVLRPEDPVLNDHLGDAFWRVGRKVEARYQWNQSLTLKPEPADAEKTRKKVLSGLPPVEPVKAEKRETAPAGAARQVQRSEERPQPIR